MRGNKFFLFLQSSIYTGLFFLLSVIAGGIYCAVSDDVQCIETREYLLAFCEAVNRLNPYSVMMNTLRKSVMSFIMIFVSAFFKAGIVLNAVVVLRSGFVMGVTFTAFFKFLGLKGVLFNLAMLPSAVLFVSGLMLFSSTSTKMSFFSIDDRKKFLIYFIIFSLISATIFCVYSFFDGFLTTTFMKWIIKTL